MKNRRTDDLRKRNAELKYSRADVLKIVDACFQAFAAEKRKDAKKLAAEML